MRSLQATVAVEHRLDGGVRLRITCATGEGFLIELSAERATALREAMRLAPAEQPAPDPEPHGSDAADSEDGGEHRRPRRRR